AAHAREFECLPHHRAASTPLRGEVTVSAATLLPRESSPRNGCSMLALLILVGVHEHPDAAGQTRRHWARRKRYIDLIAARIRRDRVGIRRSRDVLYPLIGFRIDNSEHRTSWIVSRRKVVTIVPRVEPHFV